MYRLEIERPNSYRNALTKLSVNHQRMERLAKGMIAKQPEGTRIYVTTKENVTLTTYTAR